MIDHPEVLSDSNEPAIPIHGVAPDDLEALLGTLSEREQRFVRAHGFEPKPGRHVLVPDESGAIGSVLFGSGTRESTERTPLLVGKLASALPAGLYRLAGDWADSQLGALAFALGAYRFDRYRKSKDAGVRLVVPEGADKAMLGCIRDGVFLARDLINIPANDLSPQDLARAAETTADRFGASLSITEGEALEREFPMLHAVGAGSDRPPCLIDMRWGSQGDPKITLVGKGIVFDTGGVDIKTASSMLLMKKDMGGAASVLGLASMIMQTSLNLRLRVLVPAAENAISGRAFRPGDVLRSRKGLTVEIGNTDAEGRLVLADALALADEEEPELIVTMATLTGAARVALGPELPPFFTDDDALAGELERAAAAVYDPLWRLPLWNPYDNWLNSKIADLNHVSSNGFAGSIVAALFLRRFVKRARSFLHLDVYGWNPSAKPIGPEGGEAQAIRALFELLTKRYG
jgi:leucyl aminopeptidase